MVHFVDLEIMVELKNGRIYRGELKDADDYMNLILKNGSGSSQSRQTELSPDTENSGINDDIYFNVIHVRGPSIRYVHFPDNADLPKLVKFGLDRVKAAKEKYKRGKRSQRSSTT